ncbi:hypothetical protein DER46DRAFT_570359 [Fusarium sp. MPI-SDFR-AT-0072]|nr:hypothetical protein DER46DRAFT_570359 [Fusarium sp. MPI-SDFR-AT-0072]
MPLGSSQIEAPGLYQLYSLDLPELPHHDPSKCVTTSPRESGILLDSELQQYLDSTIVRKPEAAWPRAQLVEIAVPYLTAKARTTPLDTGYQTLILDTIYATYYSMRNDASQEDGAQPSQHSLITELKLSGNASPVSSKLYCRPLVNSFLIMKLKLSDNTSQSHDLQQPQQSHAEPTPNNYTQTSSYQQPPYSSSPQLLCDSSQPDMTPAEDPSTPASSIKQQSLDTTQPQHEEHSTTDWLDFLQYSPLTRVLDHPDYNPASHSENSNEPSLAMDNEGEDNVTDLTDWMKGSSLG